MKDINNNCLIDEIKEGNNPNYDAILKTFLTDSDDINSKNEVNHFIKYILTFKF